MCKKWEEQVSLLLKENRRIKAESASLQRKYAALEESLDGLIHANKLMEEAAETDLLTGLLNLKGLKAQVRRVLSRFVMSDAPVKRNENVLRHVSLLFLDIDNFKEVNDTYGHASGDLVLKEVARCLREDLLLGHTLREDDIIARWGGEEFAIVLPGLSLTAFEKQLRGKNGEIRKLSLLVTVEKNGKPTPITVTMSGGLTEHIPGEDFWETTFRRADEALYKAKTTGRNRIVARRK